MMRSSDRDGPDPDRGSGEAGTGEYPAGTDEYSSDTRKEGVGGQGTDKHQSVERESPEAAREALRRLPPWWEREGYASLAEVLAEQKAIDDRVMGRKPRDLRGLSLEEVIFSEPELPARKRRNERVRARQVNVKLTEGEHSRLEEAARAYGLRPATLARAFVVKATEVALKRDPDSARD